MLKSLGQWTSSFKQRKIIPSQSTVPSKLPSSDKEQEESSTPKEIEYVTIIIKKCLIITIFDYKYVIFISLMCYSSHAEIKSSQERSLNVRATDDTHDIPATTDDNEKLMITQGEVNPQNQSLPKTMDIT